MVSILNSRKDFNEILKISQQRAQLRRLPAENLSLPRRTLAGWAASHDGRPVAKAQEAECYRHRVTGGRPERAWIMRRVSLRELATLDHDDQPAGARSIKLKRNGSKSLSGWTDGDESLSQISSQDRIAPGISRLSISSPARFVNDSNRDLKCRC